MAAHIHDQPSFLLSRESLTVAEAIHLVLPESEQALPLSKKAIAHLKVLSEARESFKALLGEAIARGRIQVLGEPELKNSPRYLWATIAPKPLKVLTNSYLTWLIDKHEDIALDLPTPVLDRAKTLIEKDGRRLGRKRSELDIQLDEIAEQAGELELLNVLFRTYARLELLRKPLQRDSLQLKVKNSLVNGMLNLKCNGIPVDSEHIDKIIADLFPKQIPSTRKKL